MSEEERDYLKSPNPDEILTRESPTEDEVQFSETIQSHVDETCETLEDHKQTTKLGEAAKAEITPKNLSPSLAVSTSPVEGTERRRRHSSSSDSAVVELNRAARSLDHYNLEPGKLVVFQKYFQQPKMKFFVKPEGRRRHKAGDKPQHELHDSTEVKHPLEGEIEDPLGYARSYDPPPEPTLNQAGAVIGYPERKRAVQEYLESDKGIVCDRPLDQGHSLGSSETVPMHEAYIGNFSPVNPRNGSEALSSDGISNIQVSSDECSVPSDSLPDNASVLPFIPDTDDQHIETRIRRYALSLAVDIPGRSSGSQSSSGSDPDNFKSVSRQSSIEFGPSVSTCISPMVQGQREISKDSSTDTSHRSLSRESSVDLDVYMTEKPVTTSDETAAQLNEGLLSGERPHLVPDVVIDPPDGAQNLDLGATDGTLTIPSSAHESSASALTDWAEVSGLISAIPTNRNDEDPEPIG